MFPQLFCRHVWAVSRRKRYAWKEYKAISALTGYFEEYQVTVEWIACKKCGKLRKIEY